MSSFPNFQKETLTTRSMSSFFDKALCIICQCPGGILNCVEFKATVHNMLDVSSKLPGKTFFRRLKSIWIAENVVTNDVIYHNLCWAKAKKKAVPKQKPTENYIKTLSNVEILNHIENSLVDNSIEFLDMNKLNEVYKKIFAENGENPGKISSNYKKQLKELVEENLPKICSVPSNQKNEPEKLTTKLTQAEAVKLYEKELSDALDGRLLSKLAKKIIGQFGQQIWLSIWRWFFNIPHVPLLVTFMKWILLGAATAFDINDNRTLVVENLIKTTTQFVSQNIKISRQSQYHVETCSETLHSKIETALNVGLGLYVCHTHVVRNWSNFCQTIMLE